MDMLNVKNMKEIQDITLRLMSNGAHFSYHSAFLKALEADAKVKAKVKTQLDTYKTALEKEDGAMAISKKSFKTDEIAKADQERDALYSGLKNAVKSYAHIPNPDMQKAQKVLAQVMKDYGIKTTMQLDKQTGLLVNFIKDLEEKYQQEVSTLSLSSFVAPLKTANEKVKAALSERAEERSAKQVGVMKESRKAVDEAYRILVKYINAYALLEGVPDYEAFIDFANEQITRFKQQVLK